MVKLTFWTLLRELAGYLLEPGLKRSRAGKRAIFTFQGREKGYIYFQDFIPGNDHDIRVIVIGNKAFAIKRLVRKNDFRASGSGYLQFDKNLFSKELIQTAFNITGRIRVECIAMDFIFLKNKPHLVEISYGFPTRDFIEGCEGYWDSNLNWHEDKFDPYGWIVDDLLADHR